MIEIVISGWPVSSIDYLLIEIFPIEQFFISDRDSSCGGSDDHSSVHVLKLIEGLDRVATGIEGGVFAIGSSEEDDGLVGVGVVVGAEGGDI